MKPTNEIVTAFMTSNYCINMISRIHVSKHQQEHVLTNISKRFQHTGVTETFVSNHQLLIFSFLKTSFKIMQPNKLRYREYKSSGKIGFLKDISNLAEITNYTEWENQFLRVLNKHALNEKAIGLNDPLTKKLCKKQRILGENLRKIIFINMCHMAHLLKTFRNFAKLFLLIKSPILTSKLCWWRTKRYFLKMRR